MTPAISKYINLAASNAATLPAVKLLQLAIAIVFIGFGLAKFASYEQKMVASLVAGNPALRIGVDWLGPAGFSLLLGVVELMTAVLLLAGLFSNISGFIGGLLGMLTFIVTLTILPFINFHEPSLPFAFLSFEGQFIFKDFGLLGGCAVVTQHHAVSLVGPDKED